MNDLCMFLQTEAGSSKDWFPSEQFDVKVSNHNRNEDFQLILSLQS